MPLRVFELSHDVRYRCLFTSDGEPTLQMLRFDDISASSGTWKSPRMEISSTEDEPGDFWNFSSYPIIYNQRAVDALRPYLDETGSLVPIIVEGETLWAHRVTKIIDCVDMSKSLMTSYDYFKHISFRSELLMGASVFRIPQQCASVYATDVFRRAVEEAGLKGMEFKEVWKNDGNCLPSRPDELVRPLGGSASTGCGMVKSDGPLPEEVAAEIRACLAEGDQLLGIDHEVLSPDDIQQRVYDRIMAVREASVAPNEAEMDAIGIPLGCLWADSLCRELGWEWAWVRIDGEEAPGVVSPTRSMVVFPIPYITGKLADPAEDQTSLLLYNMLKAGSGPESEPGSYVVIG